MGHPVYWIALQQVLGVPGKNLRTLLDFFGDAEGVFEATEQQLRRCPGLTPQKISAILSQSFTQANAIWEECVATGITVITPDDIRYPSGLYNLPEIPCALYIKGKLPQFDRIPAISIVGTRKPTVYGELVCRRISSVLAVAGVTVVSGGALGIDGIAHHAALEANGCTVAVLGCGINYQYLYKHRGLREKIVQKGALISEYPPQTPATRYTFPVRNRIIAALSLGTVVIEAGEKSGSLITADFALEQGKEVFAVPGSVMSPNFLGSNRLISQGATPVFGGLDVLEHYQREYYGVLQMHKAQELHQQHLKEMLVVASPSESVWQRKADQKNQPPTPSKLPVLPKNMPTAQGKDLSDAGLVVYNSLLDAREGLSVDDLLAHTGLEIAVLLRELTRLELKGYILKSPAGKYQIEN